MTILRTTLVALALSALACSSDDESTGAGTGGTGGANAGASAATGGVAGAAGSAGTSGAAGTAGNGATGGMDVVGTAMCPAARPAEGSACTTVIAGCIYDEIDCACAGGAWSCAEPVDPNCPAAMPAHDSVCTAPEATECDFLGDECECLAGKWSCDSAASDGGVVADAGPIDARCPAGRPVEDSACTMSDVSCTYEENTCLCPAGTWQCNEPVDMGCPQSAPVNGSPCTGTADCDFLDLECECLSNAWDCKAND